ncbi:MAG: cellulase family glycosylhydrolase [Candidatus Goldbacteria bacterium]|nr:cellulase family glycosylhydrolase [Candidatus Goldiibacteriota bacterium]
MKKKLFCFYFITALIISVNLNATPVSENGKLRVQGLQLVNACGYPVQLKGVSSHGLQWYGISGCSAVCCATSSALDYLANTMGIDVFRIAMYVDEGGYLTNPTKFTNDVNQIVDLCQARGIYCIIDWHILNPGDPNAHINEARTFWTNMSNTHKGKSHVLYEICNEPNGVSWSTIKNYADDIIPRIRANDPDTVIIVGTPNWSQLGSDVVNNKLNYSNIMYTFHFYAATHSTSMLTPYVGSLPIFCTEWGTCASTGQSPWDYNNATNFLNIMGGSNSAGVLISWCNWSWADKSEGASMLNGGSCSSSNWSNLTTSGQYVRDKIQSPNNVWTPCSGGSSPTRTRTPTPSASRTSTYTRTGTPTLTVSRTWTITFTRTRTMTPYGSPTNTPTRTVTPTNTRYFTSTATPTNTPYLSPTITRTFTISPTFSATPVFTPIRVNCGGPQYTGSGITWLADRAYTAGGWGYVGGSTADRGSLSIANTTDDTLYNTERYGNPTYRFDVPNGTYEVTLKFAETYWTATGARVFDVLMEDVIVLDNLDVYAQVGSNAAYDRTFIVEVTDGQLTITMTSTADTGEINAIQILRVMPTPTRTMTATLTWIRTSTPVITNTRTVTPSFSRTATGTRTTTATWTQTATSSQQPTNTRTATPTWTRTSTPVITNTRTVTPSFSRTATGTWTPTLTFTATHTLTHTPTSTPSWTRTISPTHSISPTITQTWTGTPPSPTNTPTITETGTQTWTPTWTATNTGSYTRTATGTQTPSYTPTYTGTNTRTSTPSNTETISPTHSISPTITQTWTGTPPSPTNTPTITETATWTQTPTWTATNTTSFTRTATWTWTQTATATASSTFNVPGSTFTTTRTITASLTTTATWIITPTQTQTGNPQFIIDNVLIYPNPYNPYNPGKGDLKISFNLTQESKIIKVRIFTSGLRLIKYMEFQDKTYDAEKTNVIEIPKKHFNEMASGAYYMIIFAKNSEGKETKSKPEALVILK